MTPTEQQEPPMRAPRNDDWIEWTGGECPIKSDRTVFGYKLRGGSVYASTGKASAYRWSDMGVFYDIIAYRITENHEPQEADMTGKTLKELNVKPGDVVEQNDKMSLPDAKKYFVMGGPNPAGQDGLWLCRDAGGDYLQGWSSSTKNCTIVSRAPVATPTRADLIAQRAAKAAELAALDAQIAAMPETVRVWATKIGGNWWFNRFDREDTCYREDTYYRDFPLINGVPDGFVKLEGV